VLLPPAALTAAAAVTPLPAPLVRGPPPPAVRVLDRHGRVIRDVRTSDDQLSEHLRLAQVSPWVPKALVAAEDARFFYHPGVDPVAIARATGQLVWHRRVVSGASTITQQLARAVIHRPRTLWGKLHEMVVALSIEASLDKAQVLDEYLNRVEFGPNLRGIGAASRFYLDKPALELDLAEAAALAAIPRGPTLYDPRRGTSRVLRRRNRILERMREQGLATAEQIARAEAEPLLLERTASSGGAWHLVRALSSGQLEPGLAHDGHAQVIRSTLDLSLQHEVEQLVRITASRIAAYDASAAAAIVVDSPSGEVLAYVGSPDFFSKTALGHNDGVLALRQPGSTLKPFVYAAAMQRLGMTAATRLPDVELHVPTERGDYAPRNYDGRFHGPVLLRDALANSLNVPAVYTADRVGPATVLGLLRQVGLDTLDQDAVHYGAALALGDGEIRLADLAGAYATLARHGVYRPLRYALAAKLDSGRSAYPRDPEPKRVIDPRIAGVLTDVLSDRAARLSAFGRGNALELPFPVAAKTGTSKGYRDNWTVGFTHERTVAVWVGNFDGHPMSRSSGVTGAGPLFHDVMLAAMRGIEHPAPLADLTGLVVAEVCPLSGELAGPDCPHRRRELFRPGHAPTHTCDMHVRARIDEDNGLLAGPACRTRVQERVFERYPAAYAAWAESAGRPVLPFEASRRCPLSVRTDTGSPVIAFPFEGARFVLDPDAPRLQQQIVLFARARRDIGTLGFIVDGRDVGRRVAPFRLPWTLVRGEHTLLVKSGSGRVSAPVHFDVR
jgi:penicillin-binding protein 1C